MVAMYLVNNVSGQMKLSMVAMYLVNNVPGQKKLTVVAMYLVNNVSGQMKLSMVTMYLVNNVSGQKDPDSGRLRCFQLQSVLRIVAHVVAVLLRSFFGLPGAEQTGRYI